MQKLLRGLVTLIVGAFGAAVTTLLFFVYFIPSVGRMATDTVPLGNLFVMLFVGFFALLAIGSLVHAVLSALGLAWLVETNNDSHQYPW